MKLSVTTSAIEGYADALTSEGAGEAAARLKLLLGTTQGFSSKPMEDFLALLDKVDVAGVSGLPEIPNQTVGDAIRSLRNLESILRRAATQSRLDDFIALVARLERCESVNLTDLSEAVKVQRRGRRDGGTMDPRHLAMKLKDALGDDTRFEPLFQHLSQLTAASIAQVTDVLMSSGSSGSRKKDLNRIRDRHAALRTLNAKERAMSGKSAA